MYSIIIISYYTNLLLILSSSSSPIKNNDIVSNINFQHSTFQHLNNNNNNNNCPKTLNCTVGYFDEGKDCYDANRNRCNCIAHCCLAFDCRDWGHLVQCRRKCGTTPNRFGLKRSDKLECEKYNCDRHYFDPSWDARNANDEQRNCIGHCCFAFDCRRALGYCRHACGVETWVTARPLG
ncbi:hypothetical protein BLA29_002215 [Euroglyphus maynei]|uniref:WAP domain-containing protein n=1 Tax=Euroglyphus maynei TaxID=6958 RepID=A0A1Y3B371_EURMA|nr:hypothetical protein BLA29_002215 [Euroglyphus maynei]